MALVGIVANPAAGKDIRRLVARASVFDNNEKASITRRALVGLSAAGVEHIVYMPDYFGIVPKALDGLHLDACVEPLPMRICGEHRDSTLAAAMMAEIGVNCILTLGGDGTNRAVAKACGDIPIVAVSTGTNNVFPTMIEGTIAGLAAGLVSLDRVDAAAVIRRAKCLDVLIDGSTQDLALVDVARSRETFVGCRAIWDPATVEEIFLARAQPAAIGMAAVGAMLRPIDSEEEMGMYIRLGPGGTKVLAAVAPGLVVEVPVAEYRLLRVGEVVPAGEGPVILAVDGEREIEIPRGGRAAVRVSTNGPRVVDVVATMREAALAGAFAGRPAVLACGATT